MGSDEPSARGSEGTYQRNLLKPRPRELWVRRAFRQRLRRDITKELVRSSFVSSAYSRLIQNRANLFGDKGSVRANLTNPPLKQLVRLRYFGPSPRTKGAFGQRIHKGCSQKK